MVPCLCHFRFCFWKVSSTIEEQQVSSKCSEQPRQPVFPGSVKIPKEVRAAICCSSKTKEKRKKSRNKERYKGQQRRMRKDRGQKKTEKNEKGSKNILVPQAFTSFLTRQELKAPISRFASALEGLGKALSEEVHLTSTPSVCFCMLHVPFLWY